MSIDQAICQSINACEQQDIKKKFFGTILFVGGSALFDSINDVVEDKVFEQLPQTLEVERVEVVTNKRDIDPRFLSWKGGAVLAGLDGVEDLWIKASEWDLIGIRSLRERSVFLLQ